ncbi:MULTISPECIES: PH domain-containing protein [unclassified Arthrobacter]|uniref:PH domain-containing protein n=1 Tax=unclassified Arthrobacter TaxID=235627 RepID=UPI0024DF9535|nr:MULTISPECIES: PH domain-containing protein [unclassified Arthrobacter]MCC9144175.1 PH domain-containing protein [Arthrobacter sp. zg-Y919]MDK1275400.1 PH domain-containing protein [Arthrobacter sp. zg.Y919]WIB03217.1 PH domain-containing protein [Arthrobacter sp. zg-Y919]
MTAGAAPGPEGDRHPTAADPAQQPEPEWKRVHPVSPLVRGWIALAALAYFVGRDQVESGFSDGGVRLPEGPALGWTLLALGIALVVIAGAFFLSWWFTRYQLTADSIRVHSGVVVRRQRQARLDRVQAIDIVQPLLARIFGLAELRFEVADAGESAVRLAFLRLPDAQALRTRIMADASGARNSQPDGGGGAGGKDTAGSLTVPAEQQVLALSPGRVLAAALLSGTTVLLLMAVAGVIVLTAVTGEAASIAAMVPIIFGFGSAYWGLFSSGFNFRAAVSREGIRIRSGLLDTRTSTVPPGRIQALAIRQSPLWRIPGWYSISVNVAGYGVGSSSESTARTRLLPAGTAEEVLRMLALVLPDPGTGDPVGVFAAGMDGTGTAGGFTVSPRRARWRSPLSWRRNGYLVTETAVLARHGYLWRSLEVVPHSRTQSLALQQGPVQRPMRLANLILHSTPGPVSPRVVEIDADTARRLLDEQSLRARTARRRDLPEQWLRGSGPSLAKAAPVAPLPPSLPPPVSPPLPPSLPPPVSQPLPPSPVTPAPVSEEEPPHEHR